MSLNGLTITIEKTEDIRQQGDFGYFGVSLSADITILGMHMKGLDPVVVQTVHEIHRMISINYLPFNIVNQQRLAIQSRIRSKYEGRNE